MTPASIAARVSNRIRRDLLTPPASQFDALHGIRALALFSVVAMHVGMFSAALPMSPDGNRGLGAFYRIVDGGWIGLDYFFVMSGFLIGRILLTSQQRRGSVRFPSFFVRRAMRVFPAYYLVLLVAALWYTRLDLPMARLMMAAGHPAALRETLWQNFVYVMNYTFRAGDPNAMSWAWSLCVEEHFYLALPAVLALLHRARRPALRGGALIALAALPLAGRALQFALDPSLHLQDGFYFRTHNRIDEILVGVVLAYFFVHHREALRAFAERLGPGCWIAGWGLIAWVWFGGGIQQTGFFAVVPQFTLVALGTALVMVNGLFLDNAMTRLLAHRLWYPWARVSYGMYLTHGYVVFALMSWSAVFPQPLRMPPAGFALLYALTILCSFAIAAAMFLLLERPLIDWGVRVTRRMDARFDARRAASSG